ncbi:A disintegrin and metalloproteinase with thrombospondin motifs adt-2-like [Littorina saxatilis]|uniref:Peptidase M12B domain-containing protein n=1 Tax=Littorina saxatilis TaxID=31220 RepID=A0AAN9GAJ8_9CAEN
MDSRIFILLLVPLVSGRSTELEMELPDHLQRMVRSENVAGFSLAHLHAVDALTNEERGQSRRDIEAHGSETSSDKHSFALHLASGERLRMTLKRRSIDTSGATLTEVTEDGKREVTQLRAADCFFSGPLEGAEGYANLAMCDGELIGSVNTEKRYYEVHTLPEDTDKRSIDDVMRVLVTWQDAAHAQEGLMAGDETMKRRTLDELEPLEEDGLQISEEEESEEESFEEDGVEIPEEEEESEDGGRRSISARTVVIEIADYVDSHYLGDIKAKMGLNTTRQITNLILNKWSSAAGVLGNRKQAGWDITLRLVALEIWRKNPSWYKTKASDSLVTRMHAICGNTKHLPYDQVTIHTGNPITPKGKVGLSWIGGVCRRRLRCTAVRGANTNFFTELHELGHSLGLRHENKMANCASGSDPVRGFMGGNRDHLRSCYKKVLDATFTNPKKSCVHHQDNSNTVKTF